MREMVTGLKIRFLDDLASEDAERRERSVNRRARARGFSTGSSAGVIQGGSDPAFGDLMLALEAGRVHAEKDLDAVACPFGDLGWGYPAVEPGGRHAWRRS
jgi:hypothetical protein